MFDIRTVNQLTKPLTLHFGSCYTVTSLNSSGFAFDTQFSFTEPTLTSSGTVTSGLTQISGATVTGFGWNSAASSLCSAGNFSFVIGGAACIGMEGNGGAGFSDGFAVGSFLATGTYTPTIVTVNIAHQFRSRPPCFCWVAASLAWAQNAGH
jgi:hypothetical protein